MFINILLELELCDPCPLIISSEVVEMTSWSTVTETFGLKTSDIVFTVGSTIDIAAPANVVFDIITDFANYPSWNSWCPRFTFPDGEPVTVGSSGVMQVEMKAQNRTYEIPATASHILLLISPNFQEKQLLTSDGLDS
jgi:hypothetical protein